MKHNSLMRNAVIELLIVLRFFNFVKQISLSKPWNGTIIKYVNNLQL